MLLQVTDAMKLIVPWRFCGPLILAAVLGLAACGADAPVVVEQSDPWYDAPGASDIEPEPVPDSAHYPVAPARIAEVERILDRVAISQISPSEAEYFAGRPVDLPDLTRPFLVRGLYRTDRSFYVQIIGNALLIGSHDDTADRAPIRRQPLVLIMDEVPQRIYVVTGQ
jgi:hypothetical protein